MATAGHPKYTLGGSDTVEVSEPVTKGQGVETDPDEPTMVRPWSAGSVTRQGVALISAAPAATNGPTNFAPARRHASVARAPQVVKMVFSAQAKNGDALVAASEGRVAPGAGTEGPGAVVGFCRGAGDDPSGVVANQIGNVELT